MRLGTYLLALVEPLAGRLLIALGFQVTTIVGLVAIIDQIKSQTVSGVVSLPPAMLNLFLISGGATALGIVFGAMATKLTLWIVQNGTKILGTNPS